MTSSELAEHFEVSKRTILRDIEALSVAGIPVYTTQGRGGGISLMENFVLNRRLLSEEEQTQILLALQELSATNAVVDEGLLNKLETFFERAAADWIEVDFSRWGQGEVDNIRFNLLKQAILGQKAVEFEYVSSTSTRSKRKVYPLKLVFKSKAWYLQAFCVNREDYRTFKLGRMLKVKMTDESFIRAHYEAPPIESSETSSDSSILVELEFPAHVAYRVYEVFDEASVIIGDNGILRVTAKLPEDNWLYGFLLSFGTDIRIISPKTLRDNIQQHLDAS